MRNAGLDKAQAGVQIAKRNISDLSYTDDTTLMAESKEELKSLLVRVKEGIEKAGLNSWHLVPSLHDKQMGKQWKQCQISFFGLQNYCRQ